MPRPKPRPFIVPGVGERMALARLEAAARNWRACDLDVHRERMLATIGFVSPVLHDVARLEGVTVDAFVNRIRPASSSVQTVYGHAPPRSRPLNVRGAIHRAVRCLGHVERPFDGSGRGLAICARGESIDVAVAFPGAVLETAGATGRLWLDDEWPATVVGAVAGRQLDRVVAHRLFFGSGYIVTGAGIVDGFTRLDLDLGLLAYRLPWRSVVGTRSRKACPPESVRDHWRDLAALLGHCDQSAVGRAYAGFLREHPGGRFFPRAASCGLAVDARARDGRA